MSAISTDATNDVAEMKGQIVDIFEDFCTAKGITITNPEKDVYDKEAGYEPGENVAIIFGDDYDSITNVVDDCAENNKREITSFRAVVEFSTICAARGSRKPTIKESNELEVKVRETLDNWGFYAAV